MAKAASTKRVSKRPTVVRGANDKRVSKSFRSGKHLSRATWVIGGLFVSVVGASLVAIAAFALISTSSYTAVEDTYASQSLPRNNFYKEKTIKISGAANSQKIAYIKFSVGNLTGKTVKGASLEFRSKTTTSANPSFYVHALPQSYDMTRLTWNNKPAITATAPLATVAGLNAEQQYTIPLAKTDWKEGSYTLVLVGASTQEISLYSKNSSYKPKLNLTIDDNVVITPPAPVVALSSDPATVSAGGTVNLSWSATNNPTSCTASGDWAGPKAANGTETTVLLNEARTYTFTLSCANAGGTGTAFAAVDVTAVTPPPVSKIFWGAWVNGAQYGYQNPPWDMRGWDTFEALAGKKMSIFHYGQYWYENGVSQPFYAGNYEAIRARGAIPLVDWNSWNRGAANATDQPDFQLQDIISGQYDTHIRTWATGAKTWGKPLMLRFNHEMNGTWYPWSEVKNGNATGEYVQAWRHVHDIFKEVGATNVTWVWCVNTEYTGSIPIEGLYPGDAYVDWVAIDGYNWGTNPSKPDRWKSFSEVFAATYNKLGVIAPEKPVMLAEFGSTEVGGSKAAWLTDALEVQLPTNFPRVKAALWFHWNTEGMDWSIDSSPTATEAYRAGTSSSYYAPNDYSTITTSPILAP